MSLIEKTCQVCNKIFFCSSKEDKLGRKVCTRACRNIKNNQIKIEKICKKCGKSFFVTEKRKDTAKFCSEDCMKIPKVKKNCLVCGKEFDVDSCYSERRYCCSKYCQNFSQCNTVNKFLALIDIKDNQEECWPYLGPKDDDNYGYTSFNYKGFRAHRVLFEFWYGEFDSTLKVCHKCDNPACCNPYHLFLGTNKDNVDDRVRKGRSGAIVKKLTDEDVKYILSLKGKKLYKDIAKEKNVTLFTIKGIMTGKLHKEIYKQFLLEQKEEYRAV